MTDMYLNGFGIGNYRSFGAEPQLFWPLKKINLLIGPNNSGKSNVLLFLREYLNTCLKACATGDGTFTISEIDRPRAGSTALRFIRMVPVNSPHIAGLRNLGNASAIVDKLSVSALLTRNDNFVFDFELPVNGPFRLESSLVAKLRSELSSNDWHSLAMSFFSSAAVGASDENIVNPIRKLVGPVNQVNVVTIPTHRRATRGDMLSHDGAGLIDELAKIQNPNFDRLADKDKFEKVNAFVRSVTGQSNARLEIPASRDFIQVEMNSRVLPLSSLGTGIEQVVILASICTIVEKSVVCLEEPETNLHPTYQRQLVNYLSANTSNQYFISTHSAHLVDMPNMAIFELKLKDNVTVVESAVTDRLLIEASRNIGAKPSDLLMTNCVIWVEGPSDRIYLNYWLKSDPELVEKVHYTVMFYGGVLASHLTGKFADEMKDNLVCLRKVNPHSCLIMDSDKSAATDEVKPDRVELARQFAESPGSSWITAGRTIENYLPQGKFRTIVQRHHSESRLPAIQPDDAFAPVANRINSRDKQVSIEKVACADKFIAEHPDPEIVELDLSDRIMQLRNFIRAANSMPLIH